MNVGTKSVLFGSHAFWMHPWFVAAAWWKLYGFPAQPWLWVAFFVHDIGYWGSPEMDGEIGSKHPLVGARWLYWLEYKWMRFLRLFGKPTRLTGKWGNEVLYHSRFHAKMRGMRPSNLCRADKLALVLTPWWIYVPLARLTGEIREYTAATSHHSDMGRSFPGKKWGTITSFAADKAWFLDLQSHMRNVVYANPEWMADVAQRA